MSKVTIEKSPKKPGSGESIIMFSMVVGIMLVQAVFAPYRGST